MAYAGMGLVAYPVVGPSKAERLLGWRAHMMMDDVVAAMVAAERGQEALL